MSETPKPGIYPSLDFQTYRSISAVNNSFLWTLKSRSPAHAKWEREHPSEPTPALLFGQALHGMVLEPATWGERFAVKPACDRRTKEGKAIYDAFCAELDGRTEVSADDYEKIIAIERAVRIATCSGLVQGGRNELTLVWIDDRTGVSMKARCDCVHEDEWAGDVIVDVKTTTSAHPIDFQRSLHAYGYFMQAAIYCSGWEAITGHTPAFAFLAVEKDPPFVAAAYELGPKTLEAGKLAYQAALLRYVECRDSGVWPSYQDKAVMLDMTDWHLGEEGVSQFQISGA